MTEKKKTIDPESSSGYDKGKNKFLNKFRNDVS